MASLWEPASLHTLIPYFFSLQHAHTKNKQFCQILSKIEFSFFFSRIPVSCIESQAFVKITFTGRRVFNQQVIFKISNVSFIPIHILQNADMQIRCGFLVPTVSFSKILQDIDLIFQEYCTNLTFWKYSARYWLNPICSRSNLCACARCKPEVALIYWKSSFLWQPRAHNFYPYFQQLYSRGAFTNMSRPISRPVPLLHLGTRMCITLRTC